MNILLFLLLQTYGGWVVSGVTREKASRSSRCCCRRSPPASCCSARSSASARRPVPRRRARRHRPRHRESSASTCSTGSGSATSGSARRGSSSATCCTAARSPPPARCAAGRGRPRAPRRRSCCRCSPATSSPSRRRAAHSRCCGCSPSSRRRPCCACRCSTPPARAGLGDACSAWRSPPPRPSPSRCSPRRSTALDPRKSRQAGHVARRHPRALLHRRADRRMTGRPGPVDGRGRPASRARAGPRSADVAAAPRRGARRPRRARSPDQADALRRTTALQCPYIVRSASGRGRDHKIGFAAGDHVASRRRWSSTRRRRRRRRGRAEAGSDRFDRRDDRRLVRNGEDTAGDAVGPGQLSGESGRGPLWTTMAPVGRARCPPGIGETKSTPCCARCAPGRRRARANRRARRAALAPSVAKSMAERQRGEPRSGWIDPGSDAASTSAARAPITVGGA